VTRGARIPADVDRPDRLVGGLTGRQLGILAATAIVAWLLIGLARVVVPLPVAVVLVWPLAIIGMALAVGRRDGIGLDRLVLAALRQRCAPRLMVPAPEGVQAPPGWLPVQPDGPLPAPLELSAGGLDGDGVIDLGVDGAAVICRASALTFGLRTAPEQAALVAAFARFLDALAGPVQILVRAVPVDLGGMIATVEGAAGGLPHPALERAAREHARFLGGLADRRDVVHREILVVLRESTVGPAAGEVLERRAEQAASLLAAAGITLRRLDGEQTVAALAAATHPGRRPVTGALATPHQIVTARGMGAAQ
jgi:hypothetical protein